MNNITRQLVETYLQMVQQPTPGYGEAEDAAITHSEVYDTATDEHGNPKFDKNGNPVVRKLVRLPQPEKVHTGGVCHRCGQHPPEPPRPPVKR